MINSFIYISEVKFSMWLTEFHGRNSGASDIKTKACDISAASSPSRSSYQMSVFRQTAGCPSSNFYRQLPRSIKRYSDYPTKDGLMNSDLNHFQKLKRVFLNTTFLLQYLQPHVCIYRGADKSLAPRGRKQARATKL